jgi:hypothetical protein
MVACNPDDEEMTTVVLATPSLFVNGHGEVDSGAGRNLVLQVNSMLASDV